jgi:hypothetical protein
MSIERKSLFFSTLRHRAERKCMGADLNSVSPTPFLPNGLSMTSVQR